MREVTVKVYQYDELNEKAKEMALNWFSNVCAHDEFWDYIYEDAEHIGIKITAFDLYRRTISGDIITSAPEVIEDILAEHGKDYETYKTAKRYEPTFKNLEAMRDNDDENFDDEWENAEHEFKHDILEDYLVLLRQESEYRESKEYLEEGIIANEYEFTEDGKKA